MDNVSRKPFGSQFGQLLVADEFIQHLEDMGVIAPGQPYQRVVIDACARNFVTIYVQLVGDERLLSASLVAGIEVKAEEAKNEPPQET